jgi:hypothetical protein
MKSDIIINVIAVTIVALLLGGLMILVLDPVAVK